MSYNAAVHACNGAVLSYNVAALTYNGGLYLGIVRPCPKIWRQFPTMVRSCPIMLHHCPTIMRPSPIIVTPLFQWCLLSFNGAPSSSMVPSLAYNAAPLSFNGAPLSYNPAPLSFNGAPCPIMLRPCSSAEILFVTIQDLLANFLSIHTTGEREAQRSFHRYISSP